MKIVLVTGLMLAAAAAASTEAERKLTVNLLEAGSIPSESKARALATAAKIMATAGIAIRWHNGASEANSRTPSVAVRFSDRTPATLLPGALAFAQPYGEATITIFLDRVSGPGTPRGLLGHVLAHELAHFLQGVSRHSDTGVMKANWSSEEQRAMSFRPFEFTELDVRLIRRGYDWRTSGGPALMASTKCDEPSAPRN